MIKKMLLTGLTLSTLMVYAQNQEDTTNTKSYKVLDTLKFSFTRWADSSVVPSRIHVIDQKTANLFQAQNTGDLLSNSGEVFNQKSQQGGGSPMIRGFATNRLLYSVDGVRMNTAIFRNGNIQNVISLDPYALERTEILFGPGSVAYGSDAIGGVMNFTTLKAQITDKPSISGNVAMRYTSINNEQTVHAHVISSQKNWGFVTSLSHNHFGDLLMGRNDGPDSYLRKVYVVTENGADIIKTNENPLLQVGSGYDQTNVMQKIRFSPNKNWDFQYGFHLSATSDIPRYDRLYRIKNGKPASAEWYYGPQIWLMNVASIEHKAPTKIYDGLIMRLSHQYFEESRYDRNLNSTTKSAKIEKVNAYAINIDAQKKINLRNSLTYGFEGVVNDINSNGTSTNTTTGTVSVGSSRYPQAQWQSLGAFATLNTKLSNTFNLFTGVRYSHFGIQADFTKNLPFYPLPFTTGSFNKGALNGHLGTTWKVCSKTLISAQIATAFRAPNVDDFGKFFDSQPGTVVVPNTSLAAEYAYNAEIGLQQKVANSLEINANIYYTYLDNALVVRDGQLNGLDSIVYNGEMCKVKSIQNAAFAEAYGFQTSLNWKMTPSLILAGTYNYQIANEELDNGETNPSKHSAPWFGIVRLQHTHKNITQLFYCNFSGKVSFERMSQDAKDTPYLYATDANGNIYSPGWYTLNYKLGVTVAKNIQINTGIENILDKRYRTFRSGIVAGGRTMVMAIQLKF